jgi:hypothetical protein
VASSRTAPAPVVAAVQAALFADARAQLQRAHVERLRTHIPLPMVRLPEVPGPASDRVGTLAEHLDAVLWREGR